MILAKNVKFMNEENIIVIKDKLIIDNYKKNSIKEMIYYIRGNQVMLDCDVAKLYETETRVINQAAKRNIDRFPKDFCFQLIENEFSNLRSQIVSFNLKLNNEKVTRKYKPFVFTEQGIVMLSGLLRNERAVKVSINIIEAFVEMRKFIKNNGQVFQELSNIEKKLLEHYKKFDIVFDELSQNKNEEFKQKNFEGQVYDAYSLLVYII